MRVALLSHAAPAGDAIGRQLAEKVAVFVDRGAEVRLFVTSDRRLHPALRPYTHRYAPAVPRGPHWEFLAAADLIFVEYSQHDPLFDLLPLLAGGRPRIVFDYHGVTPPALSVANHRDALERGCRLRGLVWAAGLAVVHSRFAAGELSADTGFPAERIRLLGLPVDTAWFAPGRPEQSLRNRLKLAANSRILLFVGRLAPNKRVRVLVEALAHLRELSPAVNAVIVGDGGDAYAPERDRCRERATRLGVADRLHFLGQVDESQLRDAYRDADALVIPSVHEGFCIPVVEAMACGKPVIAARAAALPETVGDAGLTFASDDAADLARQIRRLVVQTPIGVPYRKEKRRIAVVAPRFGTGFVGGAETSLRTLAHSMASAGHSVEVFTTGTAEGTANVAGLSVHRFRPDPVDFDRHAAAADVLRQPGGLNDVAAVEDFLDHSVHSSRLVEALCERGPFDAIVVGPYLLGLTRAVAEAFGERVLLMPCFHDEPFARLPSWLTAFQEVGGVLYHSAEERTFAEAVLGLNHPNAHVIGTLLDVDTPGDARRGRQQVGTGRRYVLYAGRHCREKGLPEMLAFARRYAADNPEKFTFAFIGEGDERIPQEAWARNLGFVGEATRRDVMAGADALALLSPNESLSLATLEAQAQGVPVIVRAGNAVLESHVAQGGGVAVDGYEAFAAALDDLWADPNHWRALGRTGREYVRREYGRPVAYTAAWSGALAGLDQTLGEKLTDNGRRRADSFARERWREQFCRLVDAVLEAPAQPRSDSLEVMPRVETIEAGLQQAETVFPVRLTNRGRHVLAADGPGRTELTAQVVTSDGEPIGTEIVTPLPDLLVPGRSAVAIIRVAVPPEPGEFGIRIRPRQLRADGTLAYLDVRPIPTARLLVAAEASAVPTAVLTANFEPVLRFAEAARDLPAGYVDVCHGRLARLKRWIKHKLLHNFQTAYVDVISRQQTAFNRQVVTALAELGDGQSSLAHAVTIQPPRSVVDEGDDLRAELHRLRRDNRRLRRRMVRLEAVLPAAPAAPEEAAA
jgi:glycosyltransferase involved in cell wall biosynthesis